MKNNIEFGWTWESNPGPSDEQTRHQPLHHLRVFVNILDNENNMEKCQLCLEREKNARHV